MLEGKFVTLGIESSCDETSVAIVLDGREVLANIISSQIEVHKAYGGVVPEIASRHHLVDINRVVDQALGQAKIGWEQVDLIGVTEGPGLVGALVVGIATAKAFALGRGKPVVGVHHIMGHISANYIENKELEPPFVALVISGGHTSLYNVIDYDKVELLGETRDDAAGEAFDKVARVLGLGYPGGPLIEAAAREGDPTKAVFKRVFLDKESYDFSFSGVKTGVLNYVNSEKLAGRPINVADVAAGFQAAVVDVVVSKAIRAAVNSGTGKLVLAGGVAANGFLRGRLKEEALAAGIIMYNPSPVLCTDNAAMIACAAHYKYLTSGRSPLSMDAHASLPISGGRALQPQAPSPEAPDLQSQTLSPEAPDLQPQIPSQEGPDQ